jgi:hypothetical protein
VGVLFIKRVEKSDGCAACRGRVTSRRVSSVHNRGARQLFVGGGFRTTKIFHLLCVHVQFCRVINTFVAKELLRASLVPVGARQHRRTVRSV